MRHITARWILHLFLDKQKRVRLETAIKLLKMFPKYHRKQFPYIIPGDETWGILFEPTRKINNNNIIIGYQKLPPLALNCQKVLRKQCFLF